MKRWLITTDDWLRNLVDAEDRAVRKRTGGADLINGSAWLEPYGAPYIAARDAAAERYQAQNDCDAAMEAATESS